MAKFQANGFEIDEDDPKVPLIAILAAQRTVEGQLKNSRINQFAMNALIAELGIPLHILAETDQELGE
jgi:hypothetical protein